MPTSLAVTGAGAAGVVASSAMLNNFFLDLIFKINFLYFRVVSHMVRLLRRGTCTFICFLVRNAKRDIAPVTTNSFESGVYAVSNVKHTRPDPGDQRRAVDFFEPRAGMHCFVSIGFVALVFLPATYRCSWRM